MPSDLEVAETPPEDWIYPWESSVVLALRDSQWQHRSPTQQFPDTYLALDGKIEEKIGDAVFPAADRFFLFEVKATEDQIRDEWNRGLTGKKGDANRIKKKPKAALVRLSDELKAEYDLSDNVKMSVKGHFFAYWNPERQLGGIPAGHILLEPYLLAVLRQGYQNPEQSEGTATDVFQQLERVREVYKVGLSWNRLEAPIDINFSALKGIPLSALHSGTAVFAEQCEDELRWDLLGLSGADMQRYINFLCDGDDTDDPVRVVLMSTSGSFFYYADRRSQLLQAFKPHRPMSRSSTSVVARASYAAIEAFAQTQRTSGPRLG